MYQRVLYKLERFMIANWQMVTIYDRSVSFTVQLDLSIQIPETISSDPLLYVLLSQKSQSCKIVYQQALPIWTPACPMWMDITSRIFVSS